MKMNEKLLRQLVRGILSEATILVSYDDEGGTSEEVNVTDSFAKRQFDYMRTQITDKDLAPGSRPPIESDYPAGLEPGEEEGLKQTLSATQAHPDLKINEIFRNRLNVSEGESTLDAVYKIIDADSLRSGVVLQVRRILASFSAEEAELLQTFDAAVGKELTLEGNWASLMGAQQGRESKKGESVGAVGQGEIAAALRCTQGKLDAGAALDISASGQEWHVKYHGGGSPKSALPTSLGPYNTAVKVNIDALTFSVPSESDAGIAGHTQVDLKGALKDALMGNANAIVKQIWKKSPAEFGAGGLKNLINYFGINDTEKGALRTAIDGAYHDGLGGPDENVIIAVDDTLYFGTVGQYLYFGTITSGTPRGFSTAGGANLRGWGKVLEAKEINDLRSLIREALLLEELTKSDKKEMERIAKKQAQKYFNAELDKALGTSFFGYKGKVSKYVEDEVSKRFKAGDKDKDFTDSVEKISKRVLQALYAMHYQRVNLIKSMPVSKS